MTAPQSTREFDIDFFRGWVCLSLAYLHFFNSALFDSFNRLFGDDGMWFVWNIRLGVESFFILAGFMMAHMMRPIPGEDVSIAGYLKRRFYRLIIPYWAAVLIFVAYRYLIFAATGRGGGPIPLQDVLGQLFLAQEFFYESPAAQEHVTPTGYWSMVTIEQFYLVWLAFYAICLTIFGRGKRQGYAAAEHAMVVLTFVACIGSLSIWWLGMEHTARWQLAVYGMFLTLGMLVYWSIRQQYMSPFFWIVMLAIAVSGPLLDASKMYKALISVAIFIPLARGLRVPNNLFFRFLAFCGKRSYSIYLIHPIAGIAFISVAVKLTARSDWFAIPILIAAIVVSIVAAAVFFKYVEIPCQAKARSVEYRRKRDPMDEPSAVV